MPIENFSGKAISDTYQRVVQTDGTYLADGTGSILNILNITASYALNASGSGGDSFPYTGSAIITGSLEVIGPFTASSAIISGNVQVLGTASINTLVVNQTQLSTGSNQLGDAANDTQTLFGTVRIPTGSFTVTGSTILSGSSALNVSGDTNLFGDVYASGLFPSSGNRIVYVDGDNGRLSQAEIPGSSGQVFFNNSSNLGAASNLYWDNNNQRLGIRNSNPSFNLDVSGSGIFRNTLRVLGGYAYGGSIPSSGQGQPKLGVTGRFNVVNDNRTFYFDVITTGTPYAEFATYKYDDATTFPMAFQTNGGNVLINTITDAGFKLNVNGTGRFSGNLTVTGSSNNSLLVKGSGTTSATTTLRVENANASASLVVLDNGGVYSNGPGFYSTNTVFGLNALSNPSNYGTYSNTAIGYLALSSSRFGYFNTAVGSVAGANMRDGNLNTMVGVESMFFNTNGNANTAVGWRSLYKNIDGGNNVALGIYSLEENISGNANVAIGISANKNNTVGSLNVHIGLDSGYFVQSGSYNVAIGPYSGYNLPGGQFVQKSGSYNVFLGAFAGYEETGSNTLYITNNSSSIPLIGGNFSQSRVGINKNPNTLNAALDVSGSIIVTGSITSSQNIVVNNINIGRGGTSGSAFQDYNIAIGNSNFSSSVPDRRNIAIGSTALRNLTTGYDNVAIGPAALPANTAGESNVAIGIDTLAKNTLGSYNLAISQQALFNNTLGRYNIGIGWRALFENIDGEFNIGLGTFSLYGNKFGSYNIGIGDNTFASLNLSTGSYNIALGYEAASFLRSGSYNLYLGAENDPILSGSSNTFIGSRISASVAGTNLLNNSVIIADGSGSVRLYSPSSTNVIIGGTTDLGYKLQVSGSANIGNGLTVTGSSIISGSGYTLTVINQTSVGSTTDFIVSGEDSFNRGALGTGVSIFPQGTGQRNLRLLTPTNGSDGTISIGYFKSNWYRAFSISNSPASPHAMIQPDAGNTVIGTSTDIGAKLGIRGAGSTSATTTLRVENSSANVTLAALGDGNVGIGTASPGAKLQIQGADSLLLLQGSGSTGHYFPRLTIRGAYPGIIFQSEDGGTTFGSFTTIQEYGANPWGNLAITSRTGLNFYIQSYLSGPVMSFRDGNVQINIGSSIGAKLGIRGDGSTSSTTSLRVENSNASASLVVLDNGNTGIGLAAPAYKLDVSGSGNFTNNLTITGSFTVTTGSLIEFQVTNTGTKIGNAVTDTHNITGSVAITSSSSTSSAALYVYKSGSTTVDIQGSQGQLFSITDSLTGSLMSVNDVSGLPILEVSSDDKVVMGTYGAVALTVTGSRVGVYTTTPSASLHVSGAFLGYPVTVTTASGTASLDCSRGNFFNLTLSGSYTLFLSASNIQPGQTINLRITQPATSGSLTYGSQFKFAGGIPYTASSTGSAVDIISFITFDTTNLYGSAIKNLS